MSSFSSTLASALALKGTHGTKITAWRKAAAGLNNKTRQVDTDNVPESHFAVRR
jgi:hypothetical protein